MVKSTIALLAALALTTVSLVNTSLVHAQTIYKIVNKDGTVTYSDQPSAGATEVVLDDTTNVIVSPIATKQKTKQVIKPQQVQHKLIISSPQPEETIRNNQGTVAIRASIEPNKNGRYVLKLRDQTIESLTGTFALKGLERGTYPYQINFLDNTGKVIASSSTQRFYLHKASALIKPSMATN